MMEEDINVFMKGDRPSLKLSSSRPYILRRQSTYSDNKAKVSKWTKVKAAFKWERANVPPSGPGALENHVLMPLNHEVERFVLRIVTLIGVILLLIYFSDTSRCPLARQPAAVPRTASSAPPLVIL